MRQRSWGGLPVSKGIRPRGVSHPMNTVPNRVMRLTRLLLIALLSRDPANAEWVTVEKTNDVAGRMTVYVDLGSMHREGNLVTILQLLDYKTMQGGRSPSRYSSRMIQTQFDCANERLRLLAVTDYWGKMGTGDPTGVAIGGGNWVPVLPESADHAVLEFACHAN